MRIALFTIGPTALIVMLLAGCGGDDLKFPGKVPDTPTPGPTSSTATATPSPTVTPGP